MRLLQFTIDAIVGMLFSSADPNLFGSRKRRKEKAKLSKEFKKMAGETQEEIEALQAKNPFESAAAKSAMAQSARASKQLATRYANMMGANATPEAMIAGQQAATEAVAGTAGDIATGAEANKLAELAQLRGMKSQQLGQYGQIKQSSIEERGSGWNTFFQGVGALGGLAKGGAEAAKLFI